MIKNILLVDESVPDYEVFLRSVNESTKAVPYSATTTYDQLRQAFPGPVDQVGIVFVKGASFLGQSFTEQHEFFQSLVTQFEIKHLDFLGCDTLDEWKAFYEKFTNVVIGASNNRTGNLQYGGDWVMESTAEDVESIYFTKSIEYYKYLLDYESNTIFFIKDDGYLYGTGDNRNYQLGVDNNITVASLTPVLYNSSNFTGVTKIRGRDENTGNAFTLVQAGNQLYGVGYDFCGILAPGNTFRTEFTLATLPSTGPIQDFDTGWNSVFIVQNNKLYGRGSDIDYVEPRNVPSNYRQILLNPADDNLVTNVHCDGLCMVVLANNKVYFRNVASNSLFIPIPAPTGIVQKIICYGTEVYAIIGNKAYQATNLFQANCEFVEKVFSGSLPNTLVTDIALGEGKLWYVNDNQLYGISQSNERGELGNAGSGLIPYPVGVTGTIVGISSREKYALIVNINNGTTNKLYGLGINESSQTGGTNTSDKRFLTEIPVDSSFVNVTFFRACRGYTLAVVGGVLHGVGSNFQNQIGLPFRAGVYPPIPITIDGSYVSISSNAQVSTTYNLTWLGVGPDLYAAGKINLPRAFLGVDITESRKFIKVPLPANSSGNITHVAVGSTSALVVKGNKLYGIATPYTANSIPEEIAVPAGKIQAIHCSDTLIVLIDGTPYGRGRNYEAQLGFYGDIAPAAGSYSTGSAPIIHPINSFQPFVYNDGTTTTVMTGVTSININQFRTAVLMNNEVYISGYLNQGNQVNKFTKVSMPGPVEFMTNAHWYSLAVVGGTLYGYGGTTDRGGLGETVPGSSYNLTGFPVKIGGNNITGVTNVYGLSATSVITQGKSLSWFGMNGYGVFGPFSESTLNLVTNALMGLRLTVTSSSTFNDRNYGPNGTTYKIVGDLLSKIDYVQFGVNRVYKSSFISVGATSTFAVPNGSGTVTPVITDADGNTYTLAAFNYSNPMVLESLSTSTGKPNQILRIKGVDLSAMTSVMFGTATTTSFTSIGNNEFSVVIPEKGAQADAVTVRVLDTYGTESNAIPFTYSTFGITAITNLADQAITQAAAGEKIKIMGSNLEPSMSIWFGTKKVSTITNPTPTSLTVTVPNVVGEVKLRCYDETSNFFEYASLFTCKLSPTTLATSTSVITYSTSIGPNLYYARTDKTIVRVVNRAFQVVYTHENDIYGLTNANDPITGNPTLYFGDRTTRKIYSLDTLSSLPLTRTEFYSDPTMNPMALKIFGGNMYIACANSNNSVSPALLKISMNKTLIWTRTYAGLESYQLRGLTVDANSMIYLSAVPFVANAEANLTEGRVIKLTSTGATQNIGFITGINNPKDLTFLAGYLVVDGNIEFFTPDGVSVLSFSTDAGTIAVQGNSAFFTSNSEITSTLNQLTVETYVDPGVLSILEATPLSGPQGTLVFIGGTLMAGNIVKVEVNGTQLTNSQYLVSNILLTVRMPSGSGQATIRVTYGENLTKDFVFTYVNSDITNVIPLYSQDVKRFHFTGNYLRNIVYVAFVDTQTTTVTVSNRKAVYNVTDTSFDCSFEIIPINSTRILLLDAYGNTTYEDSATFTLSSETCFVAGTPVRTDQGLVAIEKIDPEIHTLGKKEIRAVTKIRYNGDALVLLEQDSLRNKYPTRDTIISRKHKIYYKGKMKTAESLVGHNGVRLIPYDKQFLYNVLLHTHETMNVNGLICETLHPKNPIVKYFI